MQLFPMSMPHELIHLPSGILTKQLLRGCSSPAHWSSGHRLFARLCQRCRLPLVHRCRAQLCDLTTDFDLFILPTEACSSPYRAAGVNTPEEQAWSSRSSSRWLLSGWTISRADFALGQL